MKSFLAKLENRFLTYKRLTLIQVNLSDQSDSGFVITNQKGKLKVEYYFDSISQIKEIDQNPVVVVFKGKGILHKKVSSVQVLAEDFFEREFPNIQQKDFFIEIQEAEKSAMVSLCRKNIIYNKLLELNQQNLNVLDVFINPMHFTPIALLVENTEFNYDGNKVLIKDNSFIDFLVKPEQTEDVQILENIPNKFLLLYSVSLSKILSLNDFNKIGFSEFTKKEEDFRYKKVLSLSYKVVPGILLLVLIINLMVFQSLFSSKNELDSRIGYFRNISTENKALVEEIDKKASFLAVSGWDQRSEVSQLLDKIAFTVPEEINLIQLNYYPLDEKEYRSEEVFIFDNNRVLIKGETNKVKYLNNWVAQMKAEKWFSDVEIMNYSFHKEDQLGRFIIEARFE